jgi:hypothetical protein
MSKDVLNHLTVPSAPQSEVGLTYGVVEAVIAEVLGIEPEGIGALRARLRHLRNLGVPGLPRPGSGKKIRYSRRQAFEMLTTMILEHGGFTPRLAISAAQDIIGGARQLADDEDVYALFVTASDATAPEQEARLVYGRFVSGEKELLEELKELGAGFFLNVSALARNFENALAKISRA